MARAAPAGPTPGPWAASSEPDPIGKRYVIHSIPTATGVAHCWAKGDADLIAAAPDLYKALRALVTAIDRGNPLATGDAFVALQKAEGRDA